MATIELSSRYGSKLAYDTRIWGESYRLFAAKSLSGWCFGLCSRWCLALVVWKVGFVVDLGMAFVDSWVVGKEKGCYWLSNGIVELVGNFTSPGGSFIVD